MLELVISLVALWLLKVLVWSLNHVENDDNKLNLKFLEKYPLDIYKSYNNFYISKRDGSQRLIEAPNHELKKLQKNILWELEKQFWFPSHVTWFRKRVGVSNNAKKHTNKKVVINIDIENFFQSISTEKIKKALSQHKNINNKEIDIFVEIITNNGKLPQWAPTSPFMANFVFLWMDAMILKILKKYDPDVSFTRYADDITFSSNNDKIKNAIRIITESLLPKFWYTAKTKKTTIYRSHTKQLVTGLVVNEKVSYPRNKYMLLRSMVYNYLQGWPWNINKIIGHLSFMKNVDKYKYNKLKTYYYKDFRWTIRYEKIFK